jgi:hypothetical protein
MTRWIERRDEPTDGVTDGATMDGAEQRRLWCSGGVSRGEVRRRELWGSGGGATTDGGVSAAWQRRGGSGAEERRRRVGKKI